MNNILLLLFLGVNLKLTANIPVVYTALDEKLRTNVVKSFQFSSKGAVDYSELCDSNNLLEQYYCVVKKETLASNEKIVLLENLGDKGVYSAYLSLAEYYFNLEGRVNSKKAVSYYRKLSDKGDVYSIKKLALFYFEGEIVEKDLNKSKRLLQQILSYDDGAVSYNLSVISEQLGNIGKQKHYLLKSVSHGHPQARRNLFSIYMDNGMGREAIKLFDKVKEKSLEDCYFLGMAYLNGDGGIEIDYRKAKEFLLKAAKGGVEKSYRPLAFVYVKTMKTNNDFEIAEHYYIKDACLGGFDSLIDLLELYRVVSKVDGFEYLEKKIFDIKNSGKDGLSCFSN
ncbi:tetratricopeptide repeat protein [Pleionea mediterranea]|uniref:TPR repeat protein n=1 Tax=Pleionea mediterranea TaxID=523701 RepID=A0A316FJI5_9GAMM|nr:tetratricopeptide repeat protein [Pleionea mediterranea]PWK48453.1 TPR repeat protein [Pleionea mediterranea]